ncbi:hypothetical protein [Streptomyces sp. NPDC058451]|uniref:hypothetical protein n=1 Tax=Streptomyces sp. NPDC058451 TaxID=3346506 RepID=UPI00364ABA50
MPDSPSPAAATGAGRKLTAAVLGLTALVTVMLCAFALPGVNGGPRHIPVGVSGPQQVAQALQKKLDGDAWDVTVHASADALKEAVRNRDVSGGLVVTSGGIDVYTVTAGGPMAANALTAMANAVAAQQQTQATVHDLVPFPEDDPRGAGFSAAALPMIFGGIFPAVALSRLFPGHGGLRTRLAGVLLYSLVAGAAVAAFLQYGTGSLSGDYWLTTLGLALGMAALTTTFIGLEAVMGMAGIGLGAAVVMLLGNPFSGLATGPHWLPSGWAAFGQLLPPGASGSLLRANAFFDGAGAGAPALVLTAWVALGVTLVLVADHRRPVQAPSQTAGVARESVA